MQPIKKLKVRHLSKIPYTEKKKKKKYQSKPNITLFEKFPNRNKNLKISHVLGELENYFKEITCFYRVILWSFFFFVNNT